MGLDEGGGAGGMGEWEDDGWESFEPLEDTKSVPSSGADFFDTFETQKKTDKDEDLFEHLGVGMGGGGRGGGGGGSKVGKKESPPPVSSTLFGGGGSSTGEGESEGGGDWGDWGGDFSSKQVRLYRVYYTNFGM